MIVTTELVDNLANLSKLQFKEDEKQNIKADLEKMIGFIEQLQKIDTNGIEPLQHISTATNVLRDDELKGSISKQIALQNAPETDGNYFTVPKVIKK
jgi:aspartyl-tRNA(Asn)/glutamyl-tRNA(Gln) amidotransferase subunit C